jgi:hypothetical protein
MNVIDKIILCFGLPYSIYGFHVSLVLFAFLASVGILAMFSLLRAGKMRKKTAMPVIIIFCVTASFAEIYTVAQFFDYLVHQGILAQGMIYHYGSIPVVAFILFLGVCRFASYALVSASLKPPDDISLLQSSPPVAVPAQAERSRFLLNAAIAAIVLFFYLFTRI